MSGVHFTDGFDRPDTIAFGLDAPRLITVVAGALCAYALMQAPLPFALRVCVAVVVAAVAALLGWGRYAGRPLLTWAWLALRFAVAPQSGGGHPVVASRPAPVDAPPTRVEVAPPLPQPTAITPRPPSAVPAPPSPVASPPPTDDSVPPWARWLDFDTAGPTEAQPPALPPDTVETSRDVPLVVVIEQSTSASRADENSDDGTDDPGVDQDAAPPTSESSPQPERVAVLHLPLPRAEAPPQPEPQFAPDAGPPPVFVGAPRRITFFSLNGGSGRTTLATEVACILAARGRHLAGDGTARPLHVALLDLDLRSATVAVRLGIAQPTLTDYIARGGDPTHLDACMVRHSSGLRALLGPPKPVASGPAALEPARVAEVVHRLERDGAQFIVVDVGADLGAVTTWVLSAVHDIYVVITPTASGVQDAYRTTEALRRLGLAHKLRYVVNRARGVPDLSEVMGDLGGRITASIPYDPAIEDAENNHRIAALDGTSNAAAALHDLAASIYPALSASPRRTRLTWLPWRRRAG